MATRIKDTLRCFRRKQTENTDDNSSFAYQLRQVPQSAESSAVEALNRLREFERAHKLDPNLPLEELNNVSAVLVAGDAEKGAEIEHTLIEENSPYPEVR